MAESASRLLESVGGLCGEYRAGRQGALSSMRLGRAGSLGPGSVEGESRTLVDTSRVRVVAPDREGGPLEAARSSSPIRLGRTAGQRRGRGPWARTRSWTRYGPPAELRPRRSTR